MNMTGVSYCQQNYKQIRKDFMPEKEGISMNLISYGVKVKLIIGKKIRQEVTMYISESQPEQLQIMRQGKKYEKDRINTALINMISQESIKNKFKINFGECHLVINYNKFQELQIECINKNERDCLWQGLETYMEFNRKHAEKLNGNYELRMKQLFTTMNVNTHDLEKLTIDELDQGLKQINIYIEKAQLFKYMEKYDKDQNQQIDFNEFRQIVRDINFTSCLTTVFSQYCPEYEYIEDGEGYRPTDNTKVMNKQQLSLFFNQQQQYTITDNELNIIFGTTKVNNKTTKTTNINKTMSQKKEIQSIELQKKTSTASNIKKRLSAGIQALYKAKPEEIVESKISYMQFCSLILDQNKNDSCPTMSISDKAYYKHSLSQYYISSSHNTYLMGNQLTDKVNVYAYINAIKMGCRSFEIDCWDSNQPDTIKVCHGFTLTHFSSTLTFHDVINVIKSYAFIDSSLPVMLSLEIHCKPYNHYVMANTLKKLLGKQLYVLKKNKVENIDQMLNKVIIKVKRHYSDKDIHINKAKQSLLRVPTEEFENDDLSSVMDEYPILLRDDIIKSRKESYTTQTITGPNRLTDIKTEIDPDNFDLSRDLQIYLDNTQNQKYYNPKIQKYVNDGQIDIEKKQLEKSQKEQQSDKINRALAQLANPNNVKMADLDQNYNMDPNKSFNNNKQNIQKQDYIRSLQQVSAIFGVKIPTFEKKAEVEFEKIDVPDNKDFIENQQKDKKKKKKEIQTISSPHNCSSVNEQKVFKLISNNRQEVIEYSEKHYIRTYPKANRIDSSNYNPIHAFMLGCQVIALNFQTHDDNFLVYKQFFRHHNIKGYVLKNKTVLQHYNQISKPCILEFRLISGNNLVWDHGKTTKSNKLVVKAYLFDENGPDKDQLFQTKETKNAFNPQFQQSRFKFTYNNPFLTFLIIKVIDKTNDRVLSQNALSLDKLRSGYRIVTLVDKEFHYIQNSFLLAKITKL